MYPVRCPGGVCMNTHSAKRTMGLGMPGLHEFPNQSPLDASLCLGHPDDTTFEELHWQIRGNKHNVGFILFWLYSTSGCCLASAVTVWRSCRGSRESLHSPWESIAYFPFYELHSGFSSWEIHWDEKMQTPKNLYSHLDTVSSSKWIKCFCRNILQQSNKNKVQNLKLCLAIQMFLRPTDAPVSICLSECSDNTASQSEPLQNKTINHNGRMWFWAQSPLKSCPGPFDEWNSH